MNVLDLPDDVLVHLMEFIPDAVVLVRVASTCRHLFRLCQEQVSWDYLDQALRPVGKPRCTTSKERVCRFAAASTFAKRMEALVPRHHYSLVDKSCPGCEEFPDGPTHEEYGDYSGKQDASSFFTRLSAGGVLVWEGFFEACYGGNGSIYLTLPNNADLRPELQSWSAFQDLLHMYPDMPQEYLRYIRDGDLERTFDQMVNGFTARFPGGQEFQAKHKPTYDRMKRECLESLSCTTVVIGEGNNDVGLFITTTGLDIHNLSLNGYCGGNTMAPMPVLAHGVPPNRPHEEDTIKYYRTSKFDSEYMGDIVQCAFDFKLAKSKTEPGFVKGFTIRRMNSFEFYQVY